MRIIESDNEIGDVVSFLPNGLRSENPPWEAVERACFEYRTDVFFDDLMLPVNLGCLSTFLKSIGEDRCYVFNHSSLVNRRLTNNCEIAFQLSSMCNQMQIELSVSNVGSDHDRLLSVFSFVGDFGVISADADWFIFARVDSQAVFTSKRQDKFYKFQKAWWPHIVRDELFETECKCDLCGFVVNTDLLATLAAIDVTLSSVWPRYSG